MPHLGTFRPFLLSAGIKQRGYSLPLQRVLTEFGADHPFAKVIPKVKEHYGIDIPTHASRTFTLRHAQQLEALQTQEMSTSYAAEPKTVIVSQTDGSMVPIVQIAEQASDRRKHKQVHYREARLTLAHEKGSVTPLFSATLGDAKEAGEHIAHCIHKVGFSEDTAIHAVGDGATWIAEQIETHFGGQASYLVDLYHVCEYLAAAAPYCCGSQPEKEWVKQQKELLKDNHMDAVLNDLAAHRESPQSQEECPVQACYRYIKNRLHQLNYKSAIENDLPIGSGEIESAHRYVIQSRLKIQGAWWLERNASSMLALRTKRANGEWGSYWEKLAA